MNIDFVIACDANYHLLKRLLLPLAGQELNILEMGCGSGTHTLALLKELLSQSPQAVLADFSSMALAFARENAEKNRINASLVRADALRLPFPDGAFDIVWNEGVNEHFNGAERQAIFNEMARVCKLGGQVVVIVPNAANLMYRIWKSVRQRQGKWDYGFELPFSVSELRRRMKQAGLKPEKIGGKDTIASPLFLIWLMFGQKRNDCTRPPTVSWHMRLLKKIIVTTDSILGPLGGLTGIEIGVKARKQ